MELARVLDVINENENRSLSKIAERQKTIEVEIQQLRSMKTGRPTNIEIEREVYPSQLVGVEENWMRWMEAEIRAKNSELAKVKAAFENQRQRCLHSIGRKTAFNKLIDRKTLSAKLVGYCDPAV